MKTRGRGWPLRLKQMKTECDSKPQSSTCNNQHHQRPEHWDREFRTLQMADSQDGVGNWRGRAPGIQEEVVIKAPNQQARCRSPGGHPKGTFSLEHCSSDPRDGPGGAGIFGCRSLVVTPIQPQMQPLYYSAQPGTGAARRHSLFDICNLKFP